LQIIKDRIQKEYGIDAFLGKIQISYRETIEQPVEDTLFMSKTIGGAKNIVTIKLALVPIDASIKPYLKVVVTNQNNLGKLRSDRLKAIESGMKLAFKYGALLNFPVIGVGVDLLEFSASFNTSLSFITSVTSQCIARALKKADICLLEPIMHVEILTPDEYVGKIMSDLAHRRSDIQDMKSVKNYRMINAYTPLSELISYSKELRTLTSGAATLSLTLDSYHKMESTFQQKVIESLKLF